MKVPASADDVRLMTRSRSYKLPDWAVKLSPMNNHGNFIVSLGQLTPWLGQQAEQLGVDEAYISRLARAMGDVKLSTLDKMQRAWSVDGEKLLKVTEADLSLIAVWKTRLRRKKAAEKTP